MIVRDKTGTGSSAYLSTRPDRKNADRARLVGCCGVSDGSLAAAFEALVFMIAAMRSQDELRTQDITAHHPRIPGRDSSAAAAPSESIPGPTESRGRGVVWHLGHTSMTGGRLGVRRLVVGTHWTNVCARQ